MSEISTSPLKTSQTDSRSNVTPTQTSDNAIEKASCHQCRRMKWSSVLATCKAPNENKSCPLKYCKSCLWNRYKEEKKIVALLENWQCPKCRGICDCSVCRKKQGLKPIGRLEKEKLSDKELLNGNRINDDGCSRKSTRTKRKACERRSNQNIEPEVEMPKGKSLINVAGIELLPEEVGDALQFIEFCATFGEVLDIQKEEAESVIRELAHGRSSSCGQKVSLIDIHIQILSLIYNNSGTEYPSLSPGIEKDSWLRALGNFVSQSQNLLRNFPSDCFERVLDGYETLSTSQKLKLLNFLCDEAICTNELRLWIDYQNDKFLERGKAARRRVRAARKQEKELNEKLKDEVSSSSTENEVVIEQIKSEAEKAEKETLAAVDALPKKKQRSDALRTEPILLEDKGRLFWRLKGHIGEPDILLQDLGTWDAVAPHEKWFAYDAKQKQEIEKYVFNSSRAKRVRVRKVVDHP